MVNLKLRTRQPHMTYSGKIIRRTKNFFRGIMEAKGISTLFQPFKANNCESCENFIQKQGKPKLSQMEGNQLSFSPANLPYSWTMESSPNIVGLIREGISEHDENTVNDNINLYSEFPLILDFNV